MNDNLTLHKAPKKTEKASANIEFKSFITVVLLLSFMLVLAGVLSYVIPNGRFEYDNGMIVEGTYKVNEEQGGIAIWRVITAPIRVFASDDAVTIIMISVFLLVMSGVFNLLEKTGGTKIVISRIIKRLADRGGPVICLCTLVFMLFGSFFGMFEELVTLLPLIIMFMLSMGFDTMTGLGACLLAACFGFSAAITNPFSVGLAASISGIPVSSGLWLRLVFFAIIYATLCIFLMTHIKRIEADPKRSITYAIDLEKREKLDGFDAAREKNPENDRVFKVICTFFAVQGVVLVFIATVQEISGFAIPILAVTFLFGGIIAGFFVTEKKTDTFRHIAKGAIAMLPAVAMIAMASSIKLVMTEGEIIDSIMYYVIGILDGKGPFVTILLIYLLILILQVFIGSSSAKIMLVMPIVLPICRSMGISEEMVIFAYCMADGFTDVILPTNPVLLVGLSMANVPYTKWFKWTWKLQGIVLAITVLVLFFGTYIGY